MNKLLLLALVLAGGSALAQPAAPTPAPAPTPPADPAAPTAPADPAAPTAPTEPAAPAAPAEPATPTSTVTTTAPPPAITDAKPSPGTLLSSDSGMTDTGSAPKAKAEAKPKIALELSGTGSYTANQYIEYRGWKLEHGNNKGFRLEANLIGIQLAYELSALSNTQACSDSGCMTGDYGSATFHSIELGYRFRLGMVGPVRPFVAASLGGVVANAGTWSPMTDKNTLGGSGRGAFGVEYPIGKLFISATLGYRLIITPNPLRNEDEESANKLLTGNTEVPSGDYAEDLHLISGYVGVGLTL